MARIVQDSDDDESESLSPLSTNGGRTTAVGNDDELKRATATLPASKSTNGTSSTETLRREVQWAHQQLFGGDPSWEKPTKATLPENKDNAEKNSTRISDTAPSREPVGISRIGSSQRIPQPHSGSWRGLNCLNDGELQLDNLKDDSADVHSSSTPKEVRLSFGFSDSTKGARLDLVPSLCGNFARHHQYTFAEGSSTVADGTIEQQRMLEAASVEPYLPPDPGILIKGHSASASNSSIPWSAYLATQNLKSERNQSSSPAIGGPQKYSVFRAPTEMENVGATSALEPSHTPLGSPQQGATTAALHDTQKATNLKAVPEEYPNSEAMVPSKSKKRKRNEAESLRSGGLAIPLPTDQCKPRPSRSRSAQVNLEPMDCSAVPERADKSMLKRTKTTDSPDGTANSLSSRNVEAMRDTGFSPNGARQQLPTDSGGVLEEANESWLKRSFREIPSRVQSGPEDAKTSTNEAIQCKSETNGAEQVDGRTSECSAVTTPNRWARRELVAVEIPVVRPGSTPYRETMLSTGEASATAESLLPEGNTANDIIHEALSSLEGLPESDKRTISALAQDVPALAKAAELSHELAVTTKPATEMGTAGYGGEVTSNAPKQKKHGAGTGSTVERLIPEEAEYPEALSLARSEEITARNTVETGLQEPLREVNANTDKRLSKASTAVGDREAPDDDVQQAASPNKHQLSAESAIRQSHKAPKGKAPHRVGLSRRARISPLLKSVRKK